jgi:hypothetical protein
MNSLNAASTRPSLDGIPAWTMSIFLSSPSGIGESGAGALFSPIRRVSVKPLKLLFKSGVRVPKGGVAFVVHRFQ